MNATDDEIDNDDGDGVVRRLPPAAPRPSNTNGPRIVAGRDHGLRFFDYAAAGGALTFSRIGWGHFDPADIDGSHSDFVLVHHDRDNDLRLDAGLGVDEKHLRLCRFLDSPEMRALPMSECVRRAAAFQPIDLDLVRTRVLLPKGGSGVFVPRSWRRAIRTEHDGMTCGGMLHFALFGTETRETAPPIAPALLESSARAVRPGPGSPRRKK